MGVKITKGCLGEREGGKLLLQEVKKRFPELKGTVVYVDSGFSGPDFENWVKKELGWEVNSSEVFFGGDKKGVILHG